MADCCAVYFYLCYYIEVLIFGRGLMIIATRYNVTF